MINKRLHKTIHTIAWAVIVTFSLEQVAYAAPGVNLASLLKPKALELSFSLPESIAHIDEIYTAPKVSRAANDRLVYLFQDAHTNTSGQINMAKALGIVMEAEGIDYVFTEAGEGDDSLTFMKKYGTPKSRERVGLNYLRKGEIKGTEFLSFTGDRDFVLWGVEDYQLYQQSLAHYRQVASERPKHLSYLKRVEATLQILKSELYNPSLLAFDEAYQMHLKEKSALTDYFAFLMEEAHGIATLKSFPNLRRLERIKMSEARINFSQANLEQEQAIASLSREDQVEIRKASLDSKSPNKVSHGAIKETAAYYALLQEKLGSLEIYPNLKHYIQYLSQTRELDPKAILEEQKRLEMMIFKALVQNEDEGKLVAASQYLQMIRGLFELTLTPEDFKSYQRTTGITSFERLAGFINLKIMELASNYERVVFLKDGFDEVVREAEAFYTLTLKRDQHFVSEVMRKMQSENQAKSILVTGGYHTTNLKRLLKAQGISYVVIAPQVYHETDHKRYEKLLLSQTLIGSEEIQVAKQYSANNIESSLMIPDAADTRAGQASVLEMGRAVITLGARRNASLEGVVAAFEKEAQARFTETAGSRLLDRQNLLVRINARFEMNISMNHLNALLDDLAGQDQVSEAGIRGFLTENGYTRWPLGADIGIAHFISEYLKQLAVTKHLEIELEELEAATRQKVDWLTNHVVPILERIKHELAGAGNVFATALRDPASEFMVAMRLFDSNFNFNGYRRIHEIQLLSPMDFDLVIQLFIQPWLAERHDVLLAEARPDGDLKVYEITRKEAVEVSGGLRAPAVYVQAPTSEISTWSSSPMLVMFNETPIRTMVQETREAWQKHKAGLLRSEVFPNKTAWAVADYFGSAETDAVAWSRKLSCCSVPEAIAGWEGYQYLRWYEVLPTYYEAMKLRDVLRKGGSEENIVLTMLDQAIAVYMPNRDSPRAAQNLQNVVNGIAEAWNRMRVLVSGEDRLEDPFSYLMVLDYEMTLMLGLPDLALSNRDARRLGRELFIRLMDPIILEAQEHFEVGGDIPRTVLIELVRARAQAIYEKYFLRIDELSSEVHEAVRAVGSPYQIRELIQRVEPEGLEDLRDWDTRSLSYDPALVTAENASAFRSILDSYPDRKPFLIPSRSQNIGIRIEPAPSLTLKNVWPSLFQWKKLSSRLFRTPHVELIGRNLTFYINFRRPQTIRQQIEQLIPNIHSSLSIHFRPTDEALYDQLDESGIGARISKLIRRALVSIIFFIAAFSPSAATRASEVIFKKGEQGRQGEVWVEGQRVGPDLGFLYVPNPGDARFQIAERGNIFHWYETSQAAALYAALLPPNDPLFQDAGLTRKYGAAYMGRLRGRAQNDIKTLIDNGGNVIRIMHFPLGNSQAQQRDREVLIKIFDRAHEIARQRNVSFGVGIMHWMGFWAYPNSGSGELKQGTAAEWQAQANSVRSLVRFTGSKPWLRGIQLGNELDHHVRVGNNVEQDWRLMPTQTHLAADQRVPMTLLQLETGRAFLAASAINEFQKLSRQEGRIHIVPMTVGYGEFRTEHGVVLAKANALYGNPISGVSANVYFGGLYKSVNQVDVTDIKPGIQAMTETARKYGLNIVISEVGHPHANAQGVPMKGVTQSSYLDALVQALGANTSGNLFGTHIMDSHDLSYNVGDGRVKDLDDSYGVFEGLTRKRRQDLWGGFSPTVRRSWYQTQPGTRPKVIFPQIPEVIKAPITIPGMGETVEQPQEAENIGRGTYDPTNYNSGTKSGWILTQKSLDTPKDVSKGSLIFEFSENARGEVLGLRVVGRSSFNQKFTVGPDGKVTVDFVTGEIRITGRDGRAQSARLPANAQQVATALRQVVVGSGPDFYGMGLKAIPSTSWNTLTFEPAKGAKPPVMQPDTKPPVVKTPDTKPPVVKTPDTKPPVVKTPDTKPPAPTQATMEAAAGVIAPLSENYVHIAGNNSQGRNSFFYRIEREGSSVGREGVISVHRTENPAAASQTIQPEDADYIATLNYMIKRTETALKVATSATRQNELGSALSLLAAAKRNAEMPRATAPDKPVQPAEATKSQPQPPEEQAIAEEAQADEEDDKKPWYTSWWFITLAGLTGAGATWFVVKSVRDKGTRKSGARSQTKDGQSVGSRAEVRATSGARQKTLLKFADSKNFRNTHPHINHFIRLMIAQGMIDDDEDLEDYPLVRDYLVILYATNDRDLANQNAWNLHKPILLKDKLAVQRYKQGKRTTYRFRPITDVDEFMGALMKVEDVADSEADFPSRYLDSANIVLVDVSSKRPKQSRRDLAVVAVGVTRKGKVLYNTPHFTRATAESRSRIDHVNRFFDQYLRTLGKKSQWSLIGSTARSVSSGQSSIRHLNALITATRRDSSYARVMMTLRRIAGPHLIKAGQDIMQVLSSDPEVRRITVDLVRNTADAFIAEMQVKVDAGGEGALTDLEIFIRAIAADALHLLPFFESDEYSGVQTAKAVLAFFRDVLQSYAEYEEGQHDGIPANLSPAAAPNKIAKLIIKHYIGFVDDLSESVDQDTVMSTRQLLLSVFERVSTVVSTSFTFLDDDEINIGLLAAFRVPVIDFLEQAKGILAGERKADDSASQTDLEWKLQLVHAGADLTHRCIEELDAYSNVHDGGTPSKTTQLVRSYLERTSHSLSQLDAVSLTSERSYTLFQIFYLDTAIALIQVATLDEPPSSNTDALLRMLHGMRDKFQDELDAADDEDEDENDGLVGSRSGTFWRTDAELDASRKFYREHLKPYRDFFRQFRLTPTGQTVDELTLAPPTRQLIEAAGYEFEILTRIRNEVEPQNIFDGFYAYMNNILLRMGLFIVRVGRFDFDVYLATARQVDVANGEVRTMFIGRKIVGSGADEVGLPVYAHRDRRQDDMSQTEHQPQLQISAFVQEVHRVVQSTPPAMRYNVFSHVGLNGKVRATFSDVLSLIYYTEHFIERDYPTNAEEMRRFYNHLITIVQLETLGSYRTGAESVTHPDIDRGQITLIAPMLRAQIEGNANAGQSTRVLQLGMASGNETRDWAAHLADLKDSVQLVVSDYLTDLTLVVDDARNVSLEGLFDQDGKLIWVREKKNNGTYVSHKLENGEEVILDPAKLVALETWYEQDKGVPFTKHNPHYIAEAEASLGDDRVSVIPWDILEPSELPDGPFDAVIMSNVYNIIPFGQGKLQVFLNIAQNVRTGGSIYVLASGVINRTADGRIAGAESGLYDHYVVEMGAGGKRFARLVAKHHHADELNRLRSLGRLNNTPLADPASNDRLNDAEFVAQHVDNILPMLPGHIPSWNLGELVPLEPDESYADMSDAEWVLHGDLKNMRAVDFTEYRRIRDADLNPEFFRQRLGELEDVERRLADFPDIKDRVFYESLVAHVRREIESAIARIPDFERADEPQTEDASEETVARVYSDDEAFQLATAQLHDAAKSNSRLLAPRKQITRTVRSIVNRRREISRDEFISELDAAFKSDLEGKDIPRKARIISNVADAIWPVISAFGSRAQSKVDQQPVGGRLRPIEDLSWDNAAHHADIVGHFRAILAYQGWPLPRSNAGVQHNLDIEGINAFKEDPTVSASIGPSTGGFDLLSSILRPDVMSELDQNEPISPRDVYEYLTASMGPDQLPELSYRISHFRRFFSLPADLTGWYAPMLEQQRTSIIDYVGTLPRDQQVRILVQNAWHGEQAYALAVTLNSRYPERKIQIVAKDIVAPDFNRLSYVTADRIPAALQDRIDDYFEELTHIYGIRIYALKDEHRDLVVSEAGDITDQHSFESDWDVILINDTTLARNSAQYAINALKPRGRLYVGAIYPQEPSEIPDTVRNLPNASEAFVEVADYYDNETAAFEKASGSRMRSRTNFVERLKVLVAGVMLAFTLTPSEAYAMPVDDVLVNLEAGQAGVSARVSTGEEFVIDDPHTIMKAAAESVHTAQTSAEAHMSPTDFQLEQVSIDRQLALIAPTHDLPIVGEISVGPVANLGARDARVQAYFRLTALAFLLKGSSVAIVADDATGRGDLVAEGYRVARKAAQEISAKYPSAPARVLSDESQYPKDAVRARTRVKGSDVSDRPNTIYLAIAALPKDGNSNAMFNVVAAVGILQKAAQTVKIIRDETTGKVTLDARAVDPRLLSVASTVMRTPKTLTEAEFGWILMADARGDHFAVGLIRVGNVLIMIRMMNQQLDRSA